MALVYKSICNEADNLFVQILHLTEKGIRYKVEMEKLMHKGYIEIAKARYIMGSTCVTKMQLPSESSNPIKPVVTVCRAEYNNHWVFHIHRNDNKSNSADSFDKVEESVNISVTDSVQNFAFRSSNSNTPTIKNKTGTAFRNLLKNDPKALKKSKKAFNVDDMLYKDFNDELLDELSTDSESGGSLTSVTDPIRLFGILVPNTLKEAQFVFKDVVNLIGKCATIQSELDEVFHRYYFLLEVKSAIEQAAKEIKMNICKPKVYWTPSVTTTASHNTVVEEIEEEEKKVKEEDIEEIEKELGIISVKSIRSVFYDLSEKDEDEDEEKGNYEAEQEEEGQSNVWGSDNNDSDPDK